MKHYVLGDVITEISERENNPSNSGHERFVGLGHYVSGEVEIENYGSTANLNSAMKVFNSGDILVARRNVYLKRASVVYFDGLTSGDSIVLRPKNETIGRILPFILNTDDFWDYADQYSDGTMSKRLSPKVLKQYEFDLPDDNLEQLADILWAMVDVKKSYQRLLKQTDELVKSQFIELFGKLPEEFKHDTVALGDIADMLSGGTPSSKHPEYYGGPYPFVTTPCLGKNYIDSSDAVNWLSEIGVEKSSTHIIPAYSIMYGSRVGVGKSSINTCDMCTNQDILSFFNIDTSKYDLLFIKKVMDQYFDYVDAQKRGSTIKGVPSDVVKSIRIPVVAIEEQKSFAAFTEQSDKSKFELKQAIVDIDNLARVLIQQELN